MQTNQIITGEKLQAIADVYIATQDQLYFNPWIAQQTHKHKLFSNFLDGQMYNNPRVIFCYGDSVAKFAEILPQFANPFILITHNSDANITAITPGVHEVLTSPKLIRWYAQNVSFLANPEKICMLPIGIANRMWPHGNLDTFRELFQLDLQNIKTKKIYMNFKIDTNRNIRERCSRMLAPYLLQLPFMDQKSNLFRLAEYQFCICPEGNGVDTHRLWECFYLHVVPIVLKTPFTENLQRSMKLPMVMLDDWSDLFVITSNWDTMMNLPDYNSFDFNNCEQYLSMHYWMREILQA